MNKNKIYNLFFSQKNYRVLLSVIFEHFQNEYEYEIGKDEEELCVTIMEHIIQNSEPRKPDTSLRDYIKGLNRETIRELINTITSRFEKDLVPNMNELKPQHRNLSQIAKATNLVQKETDNNNLQISPRQNGFFGDNTLHPIGRNDRMVSTSFPGSNKDVMNQFEQINKNRVGKEGPNANKGRPSFESEIDRDNTKVTTDFAKAVASRGYNTENATNKLEVIMEEQGILENKPIELSGIDPDQQFSELPTVEQKVMLNEPPQPTNMQTLIKQPKIFKKFLENANKGLTKDYHVIVDSRDRNHDIHTTTSEYEVFFNTVYKDVVSIQLLSAEIPHSGYPINANNNELHFQETNAQVSGSTFYTATIPQGSYTATELATKIQEKMNLVGQSTYTVIVETNSRKFKITSNLSGGDNILNLLFRGSTIKYNDTTRYSYKNRSIGSVIGFKRLDLTGAGNYIGQNQYNINGEKYVMLHIEDLDNMEGVGSGISNAFSKITLSSNLNETRFYNMNEYISQKTFNPPMNSFSKLTIKFKNYDGSLYDFGGIEHSLFFKITTLIQSIGFMT
jgi:hypothetical protein